MKQKNPSPKPLDTNGTAQAIMQAVQAAVVEVTTKPDTYTAVSLGAKLGIHAQSVRKWVKRGLLPAPAIRVGRTVRWTHSQLEAVLAAGVAV